MIRLRLSIELDYLVLSPSCDFVFNIHVAHTSRQTVREEALTLDPCQRAEVQLDPVHGSRYMRLHAAAGPLRVSYQATVDIRHHMEDPARIGEVPVSRLPVHVLPYVYPSRYCQSDRLLRLAFAEFSHLPPG